MFLIMQQEIPVNFIILTGETYSIHEFLDVAIDYVGIA
ncbi:MAG: GDP-mannose 4,6-dehydratase, partial [Anaerolineae bacterium]|nr:GDP-mannose 4,6-dehydratase [Anaerolineae bacterium]